MDCNMIQIGKQLSADGFNEFKAALAKLPVKVQAVNAAGKLAINGCTAEHLAEIKAIYETIHDNEDTDQPTGFDLLKFQRWQRGRNQTNAARYKRSANALRFAR